MNFDTQSMPEPLIDQIAQRFRAMSEPMRIKLLCELRDGEASVRWLTDRLDTSQQNVSKHLGILHREGIIGRRKEGTSVKYSISDNQIFDLCEQVCGSLEKQAMELSRLYSRV